jgi:hypothetical protein
MNRLMQAAQGLLGNVQREPGYIYGDILPVRAQVNQQGQVIPGSREWGLGYSNAARGLLDAFTLPGRAMAGEQVTPQQAMEMAMNVTAPGVATARYTPGLLNMPMVYHGTPHRFEPTPDNPLGEFRASQIGTGEGAQIYGHGVYVAESPQVANEYRVRLSYDPEQMKVGGKQINQVYSEIENAAARLPPEKASAEYEKLELLERLMSNDSLDSVQEAASAMSDVSKKWFESQVKPNFTTYGNLYTADLPDEMVNRMLDWDKPLSEQSDEIKQKILEYSKTLKPSVSRGSMGEVVRQDLRTKIAYSLRGLEDMTGGGFYKAINPSKEKSTSILKELGIPGIKYFDEGSRDAGKGTRNFVLFPGEEKKAKIIKRE